jgi:DNA-binding NtrC family response regulator
MTKLPILVIDDDESITSTIATFLRAKGYEVAVVNDGDDALEAAGGGKYSIILSDIYIDQVTGLDVLAQAKQAGGDPAVILMTARGSVRTTVEAEMGGAFDYIAKPFEMRTLLEVIERAEAYLAGSGEPADQADESAAFGNMVGFSPQMVDVYKKIARSARSEDTVLIVGETPIAIALPA